MGCYNSSGFISKLPIRYGDRVVCFIGLSKNNGGRELYYPDSLVAPFFLPIRGEYNDYGSVEKVDRTVIVDLLEKYAGCDIDTILNGIERCLYGKTLKENIDYWKEAKERSKENGSSDGFYDKELAQYTAILPLFTYLRGEKLLDQLNKYLEDAGENPIKLPVDDVMPVLLMEHEDIYDKFTNEFAEMDPEWAFWGTPKERFESFVYAVNKIKEHYADLKSEYFDAIPSPTGHFHNFNVHTVFEKEEAEKITESVDRLFGNSDSLEFFDKLTDEERIKVYDESMDELKRFYCLYNKFALMPMYFTFSQTAGMQSYRYDVIKELYNVCGEKLDEEIKREKEEMEEYDD